MNTVVTSHFHNVDPVMAELIVKVESLQLDPIEVIPQSTDVFFERLCESIVGQQLSEKAGDTIWRRFKELFNSGKITPQAVLSLPHEVIRAAGPSNSKVVYLKNWAQSVQDRLVVPDQLIHLSDEDVITQLTRVKGIGRWTAEMFLMFSLGRPDVFSHGDLGLKNALKRWYSVLGEAPSKDEIENITKKWSPYRTFGSRVLWRSLLLPKP